MNRPGFTLLEVALAAVVLTVGIIAALTFTNGLIRGLTEGPADAQIVQRLLQDEVEAIRAWNGFAGDPPVLTPVLASDGQNLGLLVSPFEGDWGSNGGLGQPYTWFPAIQVSVLRDASLGSFAAGPSLSVPRYGQTQVVVGSHLYEIGGYNQISGILATIDQAPIAADGTLGTFSAFSSSLTTPRYGAAAIVIGNYLYVIGGFDGSALASVERAPISGGAVGIFTLVSGVNLVTARYHMASLVLGNYLYVIGGGNGVSDGANPLSSIERAPIFADGKIGTFATVPATLSTARTGLQAMLVGNQLFVLGGNGPGPTALASIEVSAVDASGNLTGFAPAPVSLTVPRYGPVVASLGTTLYVIGGNNTTGFLSSIEQARILSNQTLGPFVTAPVALGTPRLVATLATLRGTVYVLGGADAGGTGVSTVEQAPIEGIVGSVVLDKQGSKASVPLGL